MIGQLVGRPVDRSYQVSWNCTECAGQDSAAAVLFCENDKWHAIISTLFGKSFSFFVFVSLPLATCLPLLIATQDCCSSYVCVFSIAGSTIFKQHQKKVRTLFFRFNFVFHVQHSRSAVFVLCVPVSLHRESLCVVYKCKITRSNRWTFYCVQLTENKCIFSTTHSRLLYTHCAVLGVHCAGWANDDEVYRTNRFVGIFGSFQTNVQSNNRTIIFEMAWKL